MYVFYILLGVCCRVVSQMPGQTVGLTARLSGIYPNGGGGHTDGIGLAASFNGPLSVTFGPNRTFGSGTGVILIVRECTGLKCNNQLSIHDQTFLLRAMVPGIIRLTISCAALSCRLVMCQP